jgi:hypothetical protein
VADLLIGYHGCTSRMRRRTMQGYVDPFAHRRISDREDDDGEEVDEDGAVDGGADFSAS